MEVVTAERSVHVGIIVWIILGDWVEAGQEISNLSTNCVWHSYGSSQQGEVGSVTLCFPSEKPNQKRKIE
jgi:hypothetical protein